MAPARGLDAVTPEIVLVRHGRSTHALRGWLDADGMRRWMQAYDEAEITADHPPPASLVALARDAEALVASDLPRAIASARMLAPGAAFETSALLRETPIETVVRPLPRVGGLRLPLRGWALVFGARWAMAAMRGGPPPGVDDAAIARAEEAAAWLAGIADAHGRVLAVTHSIFRGLLSATLVKRGWRGPERRPSHEWSAWSHRRA